MIRQNSGTYKTTTVAGELVRAFVPSPLPPVPPIDMTSELNRIMEKALLACGRLDGISALLPDPTIFLYAYVRREAVLSSQIEGTQSSLSDLLLFEIKEAPGVPFDDVIEVSNYVAALNHGLERLASGFPLSNRLIREVHSKLMSRGRGADKLPGKFRKSQNWIGGTRPGNAHFVPPLPNMVQHCMSDLEIYIHNTNTPTLIKVALAHAQFETIHPFLDGNGRVGRLLIALMLYNDGVLNQPLLYLSLYLKQHREEYYRLLDVVRTDGNWEAWLSFALECIEQTASGAVDTADRLLKLFASDEQRIRSSELNIGSSLRVFSFLRERPIVNIDRLVKDLGISFPTASKAISVLNTLGVTRELTGKQRNRVYVYDKYLSILNEETHPMK
ncbi:MAG: Fic family protein [Ignavibacteria bacterium]|nr:Fic family protein [Ignavibacteria bacterium]